jgi:hypothetical protein
MVDKVEAPTDDRGLSPEIRDHAFLPALADPYAWIYEKAILDRTRTGTRRT